ncbi:MAG: dihydroorotase [Dehalococcoidia bacterium]
MMTTDQPPILIRGGRVLDPGRGTDFLGDVLIEGGRIAAIDERVESSDAEVVDASGLLVCPGLVDIHCHLREPGFEYKETIETGTRAAARGGFATVCCMPNTDPPADSRATVEYVQRTAAAMGAVRVLPIGCVSRGRQGHELAEMGELAEVGVIGFSDDGNPVADAALMRRALEYVSAFGLPIINHCEEASLSTEGVMHEGWVAVRLGLHGQPPAAEEAMVARDISLAELTRSHVHIAHVSTRGSVELIRHAKERRAPITAEVTPHHLTLTHEAVAFTAEGAHTLAYDTNAKVNPPLRSRDDVEACLEGLRDGTIDAIATDHAPHEAVSKMCEFDQAAFGISGFETALAACLSLVHEGRLDLPTLIYRMTAAPVAALGLERFVPGLGSLAVGAPGDVTVIEQEALWVVEPEAFASKGKNTPLAGRTLRGRAVATVVGGRVAFADTRAKV